MGYLCLIHRHPSPYLHGRRRRKGSFKISVVRMGIIRHDWLYCTSHSTIAYKLLYFPSEKAWRDSARMAPHTTKSWDLPTILCSLTCEPALWFRHVVACGRAPHHSPHSHGQHMGRRKAISVPLSTSSACSFLLNITRLALPPPHIASPASACHAHWFRHAVSPIYYSALVQTKFKTLTLL